MGKKNFKKEHGKKKMTKKEKKQMNHLRLIQGHKGREEPTYQSTNDEQVHYKKSA